MNPRIARYGTSALLLVFSFSLIVYQDRIDLPSCDNKSVIATVIVLWKMQLLKDSQPIQDGRLTNAYEESIKVANGRACGADLIIDGKPFGSLSYSVLRPLQGGAGMVILD